MRKPSRREVVLLGLLAVASLFLTLRWLLGTDAAPTLAQTSAPGTLSPVPRIGLARLDRPNDPGPAGQRDIFGYGKPSLPEQTEAPPAVRTPPPVAVLPANDSGATSLTPSLPPLALTYLGSVETPAGIKVAILVTDRKEVLTGQAGELLANRYRIARIGLESVDLDDVGTGQSRRLALRVN